ncbi:MAG: IS3 family transposase [Pseudonocardiaceae bacterium]
MSETPGHHTYAEFWHGTGPWRTAEQVEAATLHYVHWFNHHRLLETNGDLPPIELEQTYYRLHNSDLAEAG